MSGPNRNVRILAPIGMSAVRAVSLLPLERLAPGVILGWTVRPLGAMFRRAGGRVGQRRSATRAPAGRLHASRPGPLLGGRAFLAPAGIGRRCAKLRGSGGRAPRASRLRDLPVLQ